MNNLSRRNTRIFELPKSFRSYFSNFVGCEDTEIEGVLVLRRSTDDKKLAAVDFYHAQLEKTLKSYVRTPSEGGSYRRESLECSPKEPDNAKQKGAELASVEEQLTKSLNQLPRRELTVDTDRHSCPNVPYLEMTDLLTIAYAPLKNCCYIKSGGDEFYF